MGLILRIAVCFLLLSYSAEAQERRLLPEAQKAFDEGLKAVAQQDWRNAVRLFEDAQRLGGHDPRIILNLAIAHTKAAQAAPAAAWLDAYLASAPDVANADAVRSEIVRLKRALLQKADELFAIAIEKASKLPANDAVIALKVLGDSQIRAGLFIQGIQTQQRARDLDNQAKLAALSRLEPADIAVKDDELYMARARTLSYEQNFTAAMKMADLVGSPSQREALIADIVKASTARNVAPQVRETVISQISDENLRTETERRYRSHSLRDQLMKRLDDGVVDDQMLAEYSELEPAERPALLDELAFRLIAKGNLPEAEKRMKEAAKGPRSLELQTKFAVALLRAGKMAEANAAAKKAIEFAGTLKGVNVLDADRYVAVNRAVLGSSNETLAIIKTPRQVPYGAFIGDPDFVGFYDPRLAEAYSNEFLLGTLTFMLSLQDKDEAAVKLARGAPADLQIPLTNVAYGQVLRNKPQKAMEILKTVPLPHHAAAHSKAQVLGLIILEGIKKSDMVLAERAVSEMPASAAWQKNWPEGIRYRIEGSILIARGYRAKGDRENARRLIEGAKTLISASQADAALQKLRSDHLDHLLDRVAAFEEETGNAAAAELTRQNKLPAAPEGVGSFRDLARLFSGSPDLIDTRSRLQETNSVNLNFQPNAITNLALRFVWAVNELERREEQYGLKIAMAYDDQGAWAQLKDQNRPADFRAFLVQFPESPLTAEAEKKLAALAPPDQSAETIKRAELPLSTIRTVGNRSADIVAFSPDGSSIAAASDRVIALWDFASGQKIKDLEGVDGSGRRYTSLAFTPNSLTLVSANNPDEGIVRIFDVANGTQARSIKIGESDGLVYRPIAVVDPAGKLIATTFWTNRPYARGVKIWDIASGTLLRTITASSAVDALAFSPRGDLLAGASNELVALWRVRDGQLVKGLTGHTDYVRAVAFSPEGKLLASGSNDKTVRLWDVAAGRVVKTFTGHTNDVRAVAFSPDGRRVASESFDKSIMLWEVDGTGSIKLTSGRDEYLGSVAFSPDGKYVASGGNRGVLVWPLAEAVSVGPVVSAPVAIEASIDSMPVQASVSQSRGGETTAWRLIKDTTDPALLRRFISEFPESRFKPEAEARLAKLTETPPLSPAAPSSPAKPQQTTSTSKPVRTGQRADSAPPTHKVAPKQGCFVFNGRRICE
jgi:hypothetical protein